MVSTTVYCSPTVHLEGLFSALTSSDAGLLLHDLGDLVAQL